MDENQSTTPGPAMTGQPAVDDSPELSDEDHWLAVQARQEQLDGGFVYAVRSTGVYCRPSCPSRRPRRDQVVFFGDPMAAGRAGYRPCKRCQPDLATTEPVELIERARRWIEEHTEEPATLARLGAVLGVSPFHLQRSFKRRLGVSPYEYARALRTARLKARLRVGEDVSSALYGAGYGSPSRLYEQSSASLGMTPGAYRRGGEGMTVNYTIADCPLGRLLVAATDRGICAIGLGNSDGALEAFLGDELPAATIQQDDTALGGWVQELLAHLEGRRARLDLPIDVASTNFQRRVWEALRLIPVGATRSYEEIACLLGQPTAARAVARACAANPVAILVPCHRVLRKDGGLGGYRWGLERKRELLARERTSPSS